MFQGKIVGGEEIWVENSFINLSDRTSSEGFLSEFGKDFVEGKSESFLKDFLRMSEGVRDTLRVEFAEEETEFGGEEIGTGTSPLRELKIETSLSIPKLLDDRIESLP